MQYELNHHGVKGMKWGVRKKRATSTKDSHNIDKPAKNKSRKSINKKVLIAGAAAVGSVLAIYGGVKLKERMHKEAYSRSYDHAKEIVDRFIYKDNRDKMPWISKTLDAGYEKLAAMYLNDLDKRDKKLNDKAHAYAANNTRRMRDVIRVLRGKYAYFE